MCVEHWDSPWFETLLLFRWYSAWLTRQCLGSRRSLMWRSPLVGCVAGNRMDADSTQRRRTVYQSTRPLRSKSVICQFLFDFGQRNCLSGYLVLNWDRTWRRSSLLTRFLSVSDFLCWYRLCVLNFLKWLPRRGPELCHRRCL